LAQATEQLEVAPRSVSLPLLPPQKVFRFLNLLGLIERETLASTIGRNSLVQQEFPCILEGAMPS
jgi:hypothetical protein